MRSILVVDDDKEIAGLISIYLENEGYQVIKAHDGEEAILQLGQKEGSIVLIILDVMMPKLNGMDACRKIRETSSIPILMLSAKSEDMDKILGLMTGADDYMIKPFNPLELTTRVKSLLRRSLQYNAEHQASVPASLYLDGLEINRSTHEVTANGREVSLTAREFDILYLLARQPGRIFSAEDIFQQVWKEKYYVSNNTVMVHISNLRDKLEKELGYKLIQTVWGVGYKINA
ncbi:DNA-binding response regulator, OmpR family, contains REC and winged-helix (wHTH) domain [Paenibacillus uliginis N3/975]|uniref:DNA-binding response regulator, OmpR family, contains REC and winged-helix (WHTH) domain n=1 Tax=Paenibacillus uliginis N3/975 TaxID=1313296 RepID=A0A1X7GA98_9BACL|nr:response regulator transcription factor [Paenibacillus uliginis]SMF66205.1 DNA-binding response regulator, OmpR family, contains REC and winged-helix (wHTH) domain [Paenibacillus uliginis N3/975]